MIPAPPETELAIVELAMNDLGLDLNDFWYKWFVSNKPENKTVHLMTNHVINMNTLREKLIASADLGIEKIYKIQFIDLDQFREIEGFNYMYHIHIKTNK
jgi:hypothetical protein